MNRKFFVLLSCIYILFFITGCGNDEKKEEQLIGAWGVTIEENGELVPGAFLYGFHLYDDGTADGIYDGYESREAYWSIKDDELTFVYEDGTTESYMVIWLTDESLELDYRNYIITYSKITEIDLEEHRVEDDIISEWDENNSISNTQNNNEDKAENVSSIEKIAVTSEVRIINVVEDGTLWIIEEDESGQQYIVHTNVYGEVLGKTINDFDGYIEKGIDSNLFAIDNRDAGISIYDINSLQDMTNVYKGDFDEIVKVIQTEQGIVLVARKFVESFEEKYVSLKIIDTSGNEIFNISLDRSTLLSKYNIEVFKSAEDIEISYAGNNIYYIDYIGSAYDGGEINSLIIDLNRNKVIPVAFPYRNGLYCASDGNYTLVYSPYHGKIIVNNETGEFGDYNNHDYSPEGALSEGVFYAIAYGFGGTEDKAYLDTEGNIVINLEQFPQKVKYAWPFKNGIAPIEFVNGYITYIDINGEFLFEPVKGHVLSYYKKEDIVSVFVENEPDEHKYIAIDKSGNVTDINLQYDGDYFLVEYEGKKYWVVGGESGLQTQEYTSVN